MKDSVEYDKANLLVLIMYAIIILSINRHMNSDNEQANDLKIKNETLKNEILKDSVKKNKTKKL